MKIYICSFLLLIVSVVFAQNNKPLSQAHAHNDYYHSRPLLDALDHGFCSVEADIFLENNQLLIGHYQFELKAGRTLQKLYLEPLRKQSQKNGGSIYGDASEFILLIDIKTDAKKTYAFLRKLLAQYSDILTSFHNGKIQRKAVTAIISGNRAQKMIATDPMRYAGIDGRLVNLEKKRNSHLMPLISDSWARHFKWRGVGPMSEKEKKKLYNIVKQVHKQKQLIRFWATPEKKAVWHQLYTAKVDLIGTDDLKKLRQFLLHQRKK